MNVINEFLSVLREIRKDKFSYLYLFLQLVFFCGLVKQFDTDQSLVANIVFTTWLCFSHKKITNRDVNIILAALGVFALINIIPTLMWGMSPKLFLGYSGRIFLGILIVVYFKHNFLDSFEKLVFVLAFISVPLFLIQIIYLDLFKIFQPISNLVLSEKRLYPSGMFGVYTTHKYLFVFLVNQWGLLRNSGFMWEPAAFGAVLAWAMIINVFAHRFSLNPRLIVLLISAVTTFSIGTYTYLAIFFLIYLTKNFGNRNALYVTLIILALVSLSYQFDFVKDNLDMIRNKIQSEQNLAERIRMGRVPKRLGVTRVGGFVGNIRHIINEPFGYGTRYNIERKQGLYRTPNGFMHLLRNWGISSLIIILVCSYQVIKKLKYIYYVKINRFHIPMLMLIIILPMVGNAFYNQPFLYSMLLSGFIVVPNRYKLPANQNYRNTKFYA